MSTTFRYAFGSYDEPLYEYEVNFRDAKDYILRTHDLDDILKDYIDSGTYDKESAANKQALAEYRNFDGTYDAIDKLSEDEKFDLANDEILVTMIIDTNFYDDELADYFEQEAYDEYEEF